VARAALLDVTEVITGLHAVTLHVTDIQRARGFYRDVLGFKELSFNEKASRAVFGLPGTTTILSMHIMSPGEEGREPGTVSGVVFSHPDPTAACAEIKRRGGTITVEPNVVELPGAKFVRGVFADPDGNEFVMSNRKD
jgi:catechol 2,3-dioxygenase-like lactoylglutathione lyase family enzyme